MAVTFKFVAVKRIGARDLLSGIFVPVVRYSYSLFIVHLFVSINPLLFVQYFICCSIILFHLYLSFVLIVVQKKKNNSEPELCSGISIPLAVTCNTTSTCVTRKEDYQLPVQHHHLESINIIQQTPPTLS
jgi:hypothetical protein